MALTRGLFLYGTLCHRPLLEVVLGRAASLDVAPATLDDASVRWVAGQSYPMIQLGTGGRAEGVVLTGVSREDLARLDFYEGGFGYALHPVETDRGPADVYVPGPDIGPPGAPWSLDDWERDFGALTVEAAHEVMLLRETKSAAEVAAMFDVIRKRAAGRLRAATRDPDPRVLDGRIEILSRTMPYADFFAAEAFELRHSRFDGSMSPTLSRAIWLGMDAAFVLPYDPVRDRVLLVEQVRIGPIGRGDPRPWQLEPIAGHIDPGETPQEAARREALEEAGLRVGPLTPIAECYASPGNSTEFFYIFGAVVDLPDEAAGQGGLDAEDENIRSHLVSFGALMEMVEHLQAVNSPIIIAAFWLARHRDGLRATALS